MTEPIRRRSHAVDDLLGKRPVPKDDPKSRAKSVMESAGKVMLFDSQQ